MSDIYEQRKETLARSLRQYLLRILKLRLEPDVRNTPLASDLLEHSYLVNNALKDLDDPDIGLSIRLRNKELCFAAMSTYLEHLETMKQSAKSVVSNNPLHYLEEEINVAKAILTLIGNT